MPDLRAQPEPRASIIGSCSSQERSQELSAQVTEEVDRLLQRHRSELDQCLERWARSLRAPDSVSPRNSNVPDDEFRHPILETDHESQRQASCGRPELVEDEKAIGAKNGGAAVVVHSPSFASSPVALMAMDSPAMARASSKNSQTDRDVTPRRRPSRRKRERGANDLLFTSASREGSSQKSLLVRVVTSRYYEWMSGALISLNAFFIGFQTQYLCSKAMYAAELGQPVEIQEPVWFLILQVMFTCLFTLELAPRWMGGGLTGFFRDDDRWWNVLDVIVVSFSIVDLTLRIIVEKSDMLGNLSVLRVLRVIRMVRVIRVIRILKFFRELRIMIFSILRSMKALMWVVLVLAMTFYIFGIIFTVGTSTALDRPEDWTSNETRDLREYFAGLDRSFLSLFMAMSGGEDWSRYYVTLVRLPYPYRILFLLYISFCIFAVVNIVTGVFVESAMQSNRDDKVITAHEELQAKKDYLKAMRDIFEEMDEDGSGVVSIDQFEAKLADERVVAYFNAMKLDVSNARKLFWLLDSSQSQTIDIDDFVCGCYTLRGESRSLDMKMMECEVRFLHEKFLMFSSVLDRVDERITEMSQGTMLKGAI